MGLTRFTLKLVPRRWRESVERDLAEDAARRRLAGAARDRWIALQTLRVAVRFHTARSAAIDPAGIRRTNMTGIAGDVRFAWRAVRWQPWSSMAIVLTLALGIGATTAVFAVFNHLIFRPVPGVRDAGRLVTVRFRPPDQPKTQAYGHGSAVAAFRAQATALASIGHASNTELPVVFQTGDTSTFAAVEVVSSRYLETLGVRTRIGRLFTDDETETAGRPVALISDALWQDRFGREPAILGRKIAVNGQPFEIVGVVDSYRGWGVTRAANRDVWLPVATTRAVTKSNGTTVSQLVGRLSAEATPEMAERQLRTAYRGIAQSIGGDYVKYEPMVSPGLDAPEGGFYVERLLRIFWLLLAAVGLLMLLACANAANLLLARGTARARETAVRSAIGASRWRLIRQLLFESMMLAVLAGALGLALSVALIAAFQGTQLMSSQPALGGVGIDLTVAAFGVAATTVTLLVFGLVPSISSSRADLRAVVQQGGRSSTARHRLRTGLVVVQVAVSIVLLAGAGVLVRSLARLYAVDLGMDPAGVVAGRLMAHRVGYTDARAETLFRDAMSWLQAQGVDVAFSGQHPLERPFTAFELEVAPDRPKPRVRVDKVSPGFFSIMRIPIVAGRGFSEAEYASATAPVPLPVVANEAAVREWFGGDASLGRRFTLTSAKPVEAELVGIAGDTRWMNPAELPLPRLYNPSLSGIRGGYLVARGPGGVARTLQLLRESIQRLDPVLPFTEIAPADNALASQMSEQRALAKLSTVVAILALLLAASGVWAMMSYVVSERTREFGIRLALGAPVRSVVGSVVRRAAITAAVGTTLGLAAYWPASTWLTARLFEISAVDPLTLTAAGVVLLIVAVAAASLPARRATRVDPVTALRAE